MHRINEVKLDFRPREKILQKLTSEWKPEMYPFESAFLCGLLEEVKPKKVLEIGCAGGGTTAIILQCLEDMHYAYRMDSIDIRTKFFGDPSKPTGFMGEMAKDILHPQKHYFHLGAGIPSFLDEVGANIDFAILDTAHVLPGEVLDFLVILSHLTDNAVVCLHDVALCVHKHEAPDAHATNVLFHAVTADKILNFVPDELLNPQNMRQKFRYPNIAAFRITPDTHKNILDVFVALTMRWAYMPSHREIQGYTELIHKYYDDEICAIYDDAVEMNRENISMDKNV